MTKDFISYGMLTALAKGLQFLMLPLLTRLFSPTDYGVIDLMATLTGIVTILMSLSLESAVARMWHDTQDQGQRERLLTTVLVFVSGYGTVVFFLIWSVIGLLSSRVTGLHNVEVILPVAMGTALMLSVASVPQLVLRMERRILRFGILQIANATLGIVFPLILILHFRMGLLGLFVGYLAAAALVLGLSLYWTKQYLQRRISQPVIVECLKYSLPLVPAVFLSWSNSQVDRLILLSLLGLSMVGVYGAAAKIATIVTVIVEVFRLAWLPIALRHINQPTQNAYFRNSLIGYLAITTCIGLVLVAYCRELLMILTTSEYASGYAVIPWIVGAQIFYGSANITNIGMMISKKTGGNSVAAAVGTVVNAALGLGLVAAFGISGAAVGSFIAALIFTTLLLWLSLRQTVLPFDIGHALGMLVLYVASSTGLLFLYDYSANHSAMARTVLLAFALVIGLGLSFKAIRHQDQAVLLVETGAKE